MIAISLHDWHHLVNLEFLYLHNTNYIFFWRPITHQYRNQPTNCLQNASSSLLELPNKIEAQSLFVFVLRSPSILVSDGVLDTVKSFYSGIASPPCIGYNGSWYCEPAHCLEILFPATTWLDTRTWALVVRLLPNKSIIDFIDPLGLTKVIDLILKTIIFIDSCSVRMVSPNISYNWTVSPLGTVRLISSLQLAILQLLQAVELQYLCLPHVLYA